MKYSFHPEAKEELLEAINYFEECRSGLGLEFSKEIFSTCYNKLKKGGDGYGGHCQEGGVFCDGCTEQAW